MDRTRIWPNFDDAWILHADLDVVVVDKPTAVPTQAADPERPDDVVSRLRAHTGRAYLGVHQRLDRDTSGVLLFTARKEANAKIAAAFEGRSVEKRYVACVTGWPKNESAAKLDDRLLPGEHGRMRVAGPREKGGLQAISHVRVLARSGNRAMLEITLETGRTHQARVQLAHAHAYAGRLATEISPASLAANKRQLYADWHRDVGTSVAESEQLIAEMATGPDFAEGVRAYLEKRPPSF